MSELPAASEVLVSVIIPACNEEAYLPACLDSLARLPEAGAIECIVVDNGSTDRTVEIARQKGAVVVESKAATIAGVRNDGAERARAKLLAFLDADCTVEPGWAQALEEDFREEDVVAVGSYPAVPSEGSTWVQETWSSLLREEGGKRRARWLPSANLAVRARVFSEVGGFDEALRTCEDADLSYRLARRGTVLSDPRMRVLHHREPATLAAFFRKEIWHGKDSYRRMLRGGMVREELPSLLLPLIQLIGVLSVVAGLVLAVVGEGGGTLVLIGTVVALMPPAALSARALGRPRVARPFFARIFLVYLWYTFARSVSLVLGLLPSPRERASQEG